MLTITSLYTGILALIMLFLGYQTSARRKKAKISLGFGDDKVMEKRSRAFGNFVEFVPMLILLMAMIELQGHEALYVHILGGVTIVARLLHALGLTGALKIIDGRFWGAILTYLALMVAGGFLVYQSLL